VNEQPYTYVWNTGANKARDVFKPFFRKLFGESEQDASGCIARKASSDLHSFYMEVNLNRINQCFLCLEPGRSEPTWSEKEACGKIFSHLV